MRLFRHPRWQHLDYRVKVATTQENKPPTQGTRQWTFTTPRWRCGSILLPSLNAGVPEPTGGSGARTLTQTQMLGQCKCKCALRLQWVNQSNWNPEHILWDILHNLIMNKNNSAGNMSIIIYSSKTCYPNAIYSRCPLISSHRWLSARLR